LSTAVRIANTANLPYSTRLNSLARLLKKSFQLESATIYLLDRERRFLSQRISGSGGEKTSFCPIPVGEGPAGLCAFRKEAVLVAVQPPPAGKSPDTGTDIETIFLPIMSGSRILGVVCLEPAAGLPLSNSDLGLARDILLSIAGLICSREINDRSDQRIRHLMILNELGKVLHQPIPFDRLLPFVLKVAHKYTASSCTILRIFHYDCFREKIFKTCNKMFRRNLRSLLEIEKECSARMLAAGTPLLTIDVIGDEDLPPSFICVPLSSESQTFGTMTFFGKKQKDGYRCNFDEEDRELFEGMADLIATALVGVQNYRGMTSLAASNDRKLKEISLLYRISSAMHATTRINKLININLCALTSGAHPLFERAMLFLVNNRSGVMQGMHGVIHEPEHESPASEGQDENSLYSRWEVSDESLNRPQNSDFSRLVKGTRIPLDKSLNIMSRAVLEKKILLIDGAAKERPSRSELNERFRLTSYVCMPIITKNETIALVVLDNPLSGKAITPDDLHFLHLFASQAGMAIENSMLYNRLENSDREFMEIRQRLLKGERLASLGETAASIAHDLKGPLVSIGGLARRLLRKETYGSHEWKYAHTIVKEADRLEKMLAEILFFSKRATICYSQCELDIAVEESLAVVSGFLEENGILLKKRFSPDTPRILGDFQQLKQVFINLFNNAVEAMSHGGTLSISISPSLLDGKEAVSVRVRDTGGGIAQDILPNIFNPFYTTKEGGTGLGLPIVHRIVTNHGGTIRVHNLTGAGAGAEFRILLPTHP